MKNFLIFISGVATGALLLLGIFLMISNKQGTNSNIMFFDKPGICITTYPIEVFQALDPGYGLATVKGKEFDDRIDVLLYNSAQQPYYDHQTIKIPKGSCARQLGIYKYETNSGIVRTVPVVGIMK